jgi:alpha/beta superfamily hydrolase
VIELFYEILLVIGILALLIVPSIYFGWKYAFPPRRNFDETPKEAGLYYEEVSFNDSLGNIKAWYIPSKISNKIIIMAPGFGANKSALIELAIPLQREGFDLLAVDLRGQGESDPGPCTYGQGESKTILAAASWIRSNKQTMQKKISVIGFSIGASAALIAATSTYEIDTVIAESAIYNMNSTIKNELKEMLGLVGFIYNPFVQLFYRYYAGTSYRQLNILGNQDQFKANKIMLIHDALDKISNIESAKKMYEKINVDKKLWEVPESAHAQAFFNNQNEFVQKVVDYINEDVKHKK